MDQAVLEPVRASNPDEVFQRAQDLIKDQKHEAALPVLEEAVALAPENGSYRIVLAYYLFRFGEIARAMAHLDTAITQADDPSSILELKAKLMGDWHTHMPAFFQGAHAPERQVYMSAAMHAAHSPGETFELLEIGSFAGASLITWPNTVEKLLNVDCRVDCIDPWGDFGADFYPDTMTVALENNRAFQVFRHNMSRCHERLEVTAHRGTSRTILPSLQERRFDMIYIDGSHHYADVRFDITACTPLLKTGGIICGDDLELQVGACDRRFVMEHKESDLVQDPRSGVWFHPGVSLAVGECLGEVSTFRGFWAMRKSGDGFEKLSLKDATGIFPRHWPEKFHGQIYRYFEKLDEIARMI